MNFSNNYYTRTMRPVREWYVDDDECFVPPKDEMEQSAGRVLRVQRIMDQYKCSMSDAYNFIDLREEGHSVYAAAVLAGISDPSE